MADSNRSSARVAVDSIELYNARNGPLRTGCYALASVNLRSRYGADSDYNRRIGLTVLTRVIELCTCRSVMDRMGQYRGQAGTKDGFAHGP